MTLIERLLEQVDGETNELADLLLDAVDELRRLDAIEAEWMALSQDQGKAEREIARLRAMVQPAPVQEPVAFKQFLSDVHTAAGLVTHGKQCKALGERLGEGVMRHMATPPAAKRQPLTTDEVEQILAQWDYTTHGDRARYIVRMTEATHGITEGKQ